MLLVTILAYLTRIGVGDTSSLVCGCQGINYVDYCVENNRSEILAHLMNTGSGYNVQLVLCSSESYEKSLDFTDYVSQSLSLTVLVSTHISSPVVLSPNQFGDHSFDKISFGNTQLPSKQIQFVDGWTQELRANEVEFADGLDVCRISTNMAIFHNVNDAERFLSVNEVLPYVTIQQDLSALLLYGENVSVYDYGPEEIHINNSIGSVSLFFAISNNVKGVSVYGGDGRASLSIISDSRIEFYQQPDTYLTIQNPGHQLTISIMNGHHALICYRGGGKLKLYSRHPVNCTADLSTVMDTFLEFNAKINLYIESMQVNSSQIFDASDASIGNMVVCEECVLEVRGSPILDGSLDIGENGVLLFDHDMIGAFSGAHLKLDTLRLKIGTNTTTAIQVLDHYCNGNRRIHIDKIGTLDVQMDSNTDTYTFARIVHNDWYPFLVNDYTAVAMANLLDKNFDARLSDSLPLNDTCPSSSGECPCFETNFTVFRLEKKVSLPSGLVAIFVLTAIIDLAVGISVALWVKNNYLEVFS